jgi:hypothetical protein
VPSDENDPVLTTSVLATGAPAPTGPAFDIVLLAHVACVIVGLGAVVVAGVQAARLLRDPVEVAARLRSYFAPGVNWAGRIIYGVPIFGFLLLAMSKGAYDLKDAWVMAGLVLWVAAALSAEGLLWPAERRIQALVAERVSDPAVAPDHPTTAALRLAAWKMLLASSALAAAFVAATVLMVAQP